MRNPKAQIDFSKRSSKKEILDNFDLEGNDLAENLRELEKVNSYLGGNSIVTGGIEKLIEKTGNKSSFTIIDVGCGGGDALRAVAIWGNKRNIALDLMGLDANSQAVEFARLQSDKYPNIVFKQMNVLSSEFKESRADIIMFNLFLHHFTNEEIEQFIKVGMEKGASVLINDLQRSPIAYHLFRIFSRIFRFSYISRHDGKLSILKSFKSRDWKEILMRVGIKNYTIKWRWAFRYQILIHCKQGNHTDNC